MNVMAVGLFSAGGARKSFESPLHCGSLRYQYEGSIFFTLDPMNSGRICQAKGTGFGQ
jgi:hypothetical protein